MLDFEKLQRILDVLIVEAGSAFEHEDDRGKHDECVVNRIEIEERRELEVDGAEDLEDDDHQVDEVATKEGGRVDRYTLHVLSAEVCDAKAELEPGLQAMDVKKVYCGDNSDKLVVVILFRVNEDAI